MKIQSREALVAAVCFALLLPAAWYFFGRAPAVPDAPAPATPAPVVATPESRVVRLVADNWCPVSCDAAAGTPQGYAVDLARAVFTAAGYRVEYSLQPWARAVGETRAGRADAIVGILEENAPDFIYPRESIGTNTNVFFTLASNHWDFQGMASLDSVVVGVANEYVFGEPFDSYVADSRDDGNRLQILHTQDPVMQAFSLLDAGRIGAYLDDRMVVRWTARNNGVTLGLREAGVVSSIPLFIAFSPADPRATELAKTFDAGIQQLRANGQLNSVLAEYRLQDWALGE